MNNDNKVITKEVLNEKRTALSEVFWHSVKLKLKEKGKSVTWLAEEAGFSKQSIATAIYLKSAIRIQTALRLAKVLDCTVGELVYGSRVRKDSSENKPLNERLNTLNPELQMCVVNDFSNMTAVEQKAIMVHAASYFGISPEDILREVWL